MSLRTDMTVSQYMGWKNPPAGEVGIEIEVEGKGSIWFPSDSSIWAFKEDGSLRGNSGEYVLRSPCKREEVKVVLDALETELMRKYTIIPSVRQGVHVHINMNDCTLRQVLAFACCYYILEDLLVEWCGTNRVGNPFCLRALDAEYIIDYLIKCLRRGKEDLMNLNTDTIRYAALNFKSLPKFGSMEFRAMETEKNFNRINTWVEMLLHIKDFSKKYDGTPTNIIRDFSQSTPLGWAESALGSYVEQIIPRNLEFSELNTVSNRLTNGMRIAQDIAYFTEV